MHRKALPHPHRPPRRLCPGLLAHDTILSGNIAFILYALVLLGATIGWTRGTWRWCYLAIVVASCFKPPLLTLLAIPFFSARRQWLPAGASAAVGLGIFAAQSRAVPSLFLHFMQAVQLQFTYNNDFGSAPAGVFSNFLVHHGVAYSPASLVFYLLYAAAIVSVLFYLSRQYLDGDLTLQQWMPVLLTGTILLNPRIMEYDAAPIAIPMALIAWRFFTRDGITARAVLNYLGVFVVANLVAVNVAGAWKPTECLLLATVFCEPVHGASCSTTKPPSPPPRPPRKWKPTKSSSPPKTITTWDHPHQQRPANSHCGRFSLPLPSSPQPKTVYILSAAELTRHPACSCSMV